MRRSVCLTAICLLGLSFIPSAQAGPPSSPCPLAVSPRDPGWTAITLPEFTPSEHENFDRPGAESFSVDPADPQHIIVGGAKDIFRTKDGGCTWARVPPTVVSGVTMPNPSWHVTDVDIARVGTQVRYYAQLSADVSLGNDVTGTSVVLYSDDEGASWQAIDPTGNPHFSIGRGWITVAPSDPRTLYITRGTRATWSLFVSNDSGQSWEERTVPGIQPEIYMSPDAIGSRSPLVVSGTDPNEVWAGAKILGMRQGTVVIPGSQPNALIHSVDGGVTWEMIQNPITEAGQIFYTVDVFHKAGEQARLAIATGQRIYTSEDGGISWKLILGPITQGMVVSHVTFGKDSRFLFVEDSSSTVLRFDLVRGAALGIKQRSYADEAADDGFFWHPPRYVSGGGFLTLGSCAPRMGGYIVVYVWDCDSLYRFAGRGT